jgi:hypothetical protein
VRTVFWHWFALAPAGHSPQLFASQSTRQPVSALHVELTNGATHAKMPEPLPLMPSGTSKGARHAPHDALFACSNWKNDWHAAELAPLAQAARASSRSLVVHGCCTFGAFVVAVHEPAL